MPPLPWPPEGDALTQVGGSRGPSKDLVKRWMPRGGGKANNAMGAPFYMLPRPAHRHTGPGESRGPSKAPLQPTLKTLDAQAGG